MDKYSETYGVEVRYVTTGIFGTAEAAIQTWDETTFADEGQLLGATLGMTFPHSESPRFTLCPAVSFRSTSGPEGAEGIDWVYSEKRFSGSLSIGYLVNRSRKGWELVPTATLTVGTTNTEMKTDAGVSKPSYKDFCCGSRGFGTVTMGLGLGLGRTVSILPFISFPLDAAGQTTYSAHVLFGLGRELIN